MSLTTHTDHWIDPSETERTGSRIFAHLLLICIAAAVISFIAWAHFAVLDQVTRGEGRVIPSSQTQVIQNLEGGILSDIVVREGDIVAKDQVLLRIDNSTASSNYEELHQRYFSTAASVARLEAEVADKDVSEITYPEDVLKDAPKVADAQTALFKTRHAQLVSQVGILQDQMAQRQQELNELDNKAKRLKQSLDLASQELKITRPLAAQGVVAQTDLLKIEREVNDMQGEMEATDLARPRAVAAMNEAKSRVSERLATFKADAAEELNKLRAELASIKASLTADKDRVRRTEVRSPVHGTVKEIKIRTVGGVIQPGQDIMEIVPIEDSLLIEAQVRPSDIAFIRPDQKAMVKISAYDFSIYGGLDATVDHISADTIENEKKEQFYRIRLRTAKNFLGTAEKPLPIIPGMTASVDILTGKKSVLDYLLKPILKARDSALREK